MHNHAPTEKFPLAFFVLTFRKSGRDGVKKLLGRIFDFRRIAQKKWYAPILLLLPLISLLSIVVMVLSGAPIPAGLVPVVALPAVFLFLVILAAWIFNNTGKSVFAVILFHAADNAALVTLPEIRSIYPWAAVVHCGLVLVAAVVVSWLWGAGTLSRFRFAN